MIKKTVPAVWFQNKLNPAQSITKKPEMLELFERELAHVIGGVSGGALSAADTCSRCVPDDSSPD
jgi:hypothetical protein